jgi:hypothetical protein
VNRLDWMAFCFFLLVCGLAAIFLVLWLTSKFRHFWSTFVSRKVSPLWQVRDGPSTNHLVDEIKWSLNFHVIKMSSPETKFWFFQLDLSIQTFGILVKCQKSWWFELTLADKVKRHLGEKNDSIIFYCVLFWIAIHRISEQISYIPLDCLFLSQLMLFLEKMWNNKIICTDSWNFSFFALTAVQNSKFLRIYRPGIIRLPVNLF